MPLQVDRTLVAGGERDGCAGITSNSSSSAGSSGNQLALSKLTKAACWGKGIYFAT